jgi:hypothetical protein
VSARTPAIQPASIDAHYASARLRLVAPAATPARPQEASLLVSRFSSDSELHGTCALCWAGPCQLAGSVRRHPVNSLDDAAERGICSRCLVTLEMLAVQFEPQLRLRVDTPA